MAVSQVYVRDNKVVPPLTPLSCLDCKTQLYGERHTSLPNWFPHQPRQSRQAPRSPSWEGPPSWLPVPPLTWRSGLPLFLSEPAAWEGPMSLILPGEAAGHLGFPALITHTGSAQALPPPRWHLSSHGWEPGLGKIRPGPVVSVPVGQLGPRTTSTICTRVAWLGEPGQSQVPKLGRHRTEKTRWKLDDNLGRGYKSLRSYSKKKSHPVPELWA